MNRRERQHDERERPAAPATPATDSDLRAAAERLLARGADAIERALSQDSTAFLAANQQTGGQ